MQSKPFYPEVKCVRDQSRGGNLLLPVDYFEHPSLEPDSRFDEGFIYVYPTPYEENLEHPVDFSVGPMMDGGRLTISASLSARSCQERVPAIGYTVHVETSAIGGEGWHGLMVEQSVDWEKSESRYMGDCIFNSPRYRCISMILGNEKATVLLPRACMLVDPERSVADRASAAAYLLRAVGAIRLDGK